MQAKDKTIRICLVGGEDAYKRIELSGYLTQNNFEVTILGTKHHDYPSHINFIKYNLNRSLNLRSDIKTIVEYRKIFAENNFDIIQTFDTKPAFLVPLARPNAPTRVVRTITGLGTIFMGDSLKFKILRFVYKLLHRLAKYRVDHTTFQNTADRGFFLKNNLVSNLNSSLIFGSGIDLSKFKERATRQNTPFTFIFVSRLVYEKGVLNYLEAAKICKSQNHDFRFLLVGPLEENSSKLNRGVLTEYENIVEWLGARQDVKDLMLTADAFVLPTFREGLSRVLLEASALGLPIITTNVPGTKEIVKDGIEGLLIKTDDSNDLAKKMISLAIDKELANTLSENAIKNVAKFSLEKISREYIELYKSIT